MLQASAADSLARVAGAKHDYITLYVSQSNVADTCRASAWRSSAQQYLLYSWYTKGICGIKLAAKPGTSNHGTLFFFVSRLTTHKREDVL